MGNRKPIAALLGTVLLALAVLPVGLAHADSAAAFTNFTLSAISPVCFGSTPSVTITAGVANPSSDSCEIVITNQIWSWSASGGGVCFPTNGNGGTGWTWSNAPAGNNGITVTVNVTFQGTNCNGGFSTNISGSTNFTVTIIEITNQCVAPIPTNRTRLTLGVCEEVKLTINPMPSGGVTWSLQGGGSLSSYNDQTITYTAPATKGASAVFATFPNGSPCDIGFNTIEPDGSYTDSKTQETTNNSIYAAGQQGCAMYCDVIVNPTTVSFYNVEIKEIGEDANNIWGWFATNNYSPSSLPHTPGPWQYLG